MSERMPALIVAEMSEVEQLALLSLCDGGPISEALVSKLYKKRLAAITEHGTKLNPKIRRRPSALGIDVADYIRAHGTTPEREQGGAG